MATERLGGNDSRQAEPRDPFETDPHEMMFSLIDTRNRNPESGIKVVIVRFPHSKDREGSQLPVIIDISGIKTETDIPTIEGRLDQIAEAMGGNSLDVLKAIGRPDFVINEDPFSFAQRLLSESREARVKFKKAKARNDLDIAQKHMRERLELAWDLAKSSKQRPNFEFLKIGILTYSNGPKIEFSMALQNGDEDSATFPLFYSQELYTYIKQHGSFDYKARLARKNLK